MGFFKNLFKRDQQIENDQRQQLMERQAELWIKKAEANQPIDIQKDMEKVYGLDKIQQKKAEREQTKEIIKGAVAGAIIAGDAGAVVGATIAKNKIDNRNNQTVEESFHYTPTYSAQTKAVITTSSKATDENPFTNYYSVEDIRSQLTGNEQDDIVLIVTELGYALVAQIDEILGYNDRTKTSKIVRGMMHEGKLERVVVNYKAWFRLPKKADTISTADELKKFKELLDMGVITQAEFDAKKKQLLGL